jgi:hypothetical protein
MSSNPAQKRAAKAHSFCCSLRTTHKRNRKILTVNWHCIHVRLPCTDIFTAATISFLYLQYVTLHESRPLSKIMLSRTTSLLHVACNDTDRNRYSILPTYTQNYNISIPPHYSKFQIINSELENSRSCFHAV